MTVKKKAIARKPIMKVMPRPPFQPPGFKISFKKGDRVLVAPYLQTSTGTFDVRRGEPLPGTIREYVNGTYPPNYIIDLDDDTYTSASEDFLEHEPSKLRTVLD